MTYAAYGEALLGWLADDAHPPRLLPLPAAYASYLQPGYVEALATRVEVTDEHDRPVPLPDSNCLIVVEKT